MKPREIKEGRWYEGADGERRKVCERFAASSAWAGIYRRGMRLVLLEESSEKRLWFIVPLSTFARWAKREVKP